MNTPAEMMTLEDVRQRLELMQRALLIDHEAGQELLAIAIELLRRLEKQPRAAVR